MNDGPSDRIRRILASVVGEDSGSSDADMEDRGRLLDTAARAVSARLERWGSGDALRRWVGGVERDVLTGPGEWVELEAQIGVAAKLGGVARFTVDGQVVAKQDIQQTSVRAMIRAPNPGLYELGVELDGAGIELLGHRVLQVASGRPLVLIDAELLFKQADGRPPTVAPATLLRGLAGADLEFAYFDIHDENRRAAIYEALAVQQLPRAATMLFAAEEHAIERLGLDFAHLFGMTALRRYLARGVPIVAIISERFTSTIDPVVVLRPERALARAAALEFTHEHAAAREFVASRRDADPITWRLDQATGTRSVAGNRFHAELDNARARVRLFELIEAAQRSIHLQVYQVRPGEFTEQLVVALIRRARTGVEVRVMVDALYTEQVLGRQNPLLQSLETEPNVSVLALSPIGTRHDVDVTRLKQRDHRKLVIVDGEHALVSGRNVGDVHYRGFDEVAIHDNTPFERIPWLDAHIEVEGPLVADVQRMFLATWVEQGGVEQGGDLAGLIAAPEPAGPSRGRLIVHHGLADANALSMYEAMLDVAEDHVILVNDFPIVSTLERAILRLLARGVRVELLTGNAAARRDDGSMFRAGIHRTLFEHMVKAKLEPLMLAGVQIYEYTTPPSPTVVARGGRIRPYVHAKLMSVDGKLCSIGSANLDATASFWESEANIVVEDPTFVAALELELRGLIDASLRLDPESEYWKRERAQRAVVGTLWPVSLYS